MVISSSSPFGGGTRTRVLLALSLLGESYPRELSRCWTHPCPVFRGRCRASSWTASWPGGPWGGPACSSWIHGVSLEMPSSSFCAGSRSPRLDFRGRSRRSAAGHGERASRCETFWAVQPRRRGGSGGGCAAHSQDLGCLDGWSVRGPLQRGGLPFEGPGLHCGRERHPQADGYRHGVDRLHSKTRPPRCVLSLG
jgi:hypothetical protein